MIKVGSKQIPEYNDSSVASEVSNEDMPDRVQMIVDDSSPMFCYQDN